MSFRNLLNLSTGKISNDWLPYGSGGIPILPYMTNVSWDTTDIVAIDTDTDFTDFTVGDGDLSFNPNWLVDYDYLQVIFTINLQKLEITKSTPGDVTDTSVPMYVLAKSNVTNQFQIFNLTNKSGNIGAVYADTTDGLYSGSFTYLDYIPTAGLTGTSIPVTLYAFFCSPVAVAGTYISTSQRVGTKVSVTATIRPVDQ